jgi:hypothetical protein
MKSFPKFKIDQTKLEELEKAARAVGGSPMFNFSISTPEEAFVENVMEVYKLEKPIGETVCRGAKDLIENFIEMLGEFFFCSLTYLFKDRYQLCFSRFRTLIEVVEQFHLHDSHADLAGLLFGYPLNDIAGYCTTDRMRKMARIFK